MQRKGLSKLGILGISSVVIGSSGWIASTILVFISYQPGLGAVPFRILHMPFFLQIFLWTPLMIFGAGLITSDMLRILTRAKVKYIKKIKI